MPSIDLKPFGGVAVKSHTKRPKGKGGAQEAKEVLGLKKEKEDRDASGEESTGREIEKRMKGSKAWMR